MAGQSPAADRPLRGEGVVSFAFDVASEIATDRVRKLLSRVPTRLALRTGPAAPRSVPVYLPLEIDPGLALCAGGRPVRIVVRVYDVGVVTVTLRVPFAAATPGELRAFHTLTLDDGRPAEAVAVALCTDVCRELSSVMTRPGPASEPEAYTVFCLTELGGERDATRWLAGRERGSPACWPTPTRTGLAKPKSPRCSGCGGRS